MPKAQVMMEFMIALTIVVFVCGTAFYISAQRSDELNYLKTKEAATDVCSSVASAIDEVWSMGNGATLYINIPQNVNFINYSAQITSYNSFIIEFSSNAVICPFAANVSNGTSNNFTVPSGNMKFFNDNIKVVISGA